MRSAVSTVNTPRTALVRLAATASPRARIWMPACLASWGTLAEAGPGATLNIRVCAAAGVALTAATIATALASIWL